MKQKIFRAPLVLKADGQEGEFTAVFSTLNVIDHHDDVTLTGAFMEQPVVIEPWNHGWTLPSGKGVIKSDDKRAWVEGQFFMNTEVGREHHATVKELGDLAEWSYTFDILESERGEFQGQQVQFLRKLDVVGVGPVTRGAGIGTGTVAIKGSAKADHKGGTKGDGDEGEVSSAGSEQAGDDKPSGPDPDLLAQIDLVEVGLIYLETVSQE